MSLTKKDMIGTNQYEIAFSVAKDVFEAAVNAAYKKQVGKINVPGFRKGKAPRVIIEKLYGKGVFYDEALNACAPAAYAEAAKESGLDIVGQPEMDVESIDDEGVVLKAKVYVKPEVTLKEYKGLTAVKTVRPVTDAEVDAEVDRARERNSRTVDVTDRAAAIKNGPGELSIANLEKWLKTAADNGETDTEEYRRKEGALALQYQRLGALDQAYDQTEATPPPGLLDGAGLADSLAKIGGSVGPSVDVADVNRDLLATLRDFFQAWRTRAGLDPASAKGIDAASRFAPHATFG